MAERSSPVRGRLSSRVFCVSAYAVLYSVRRRRPSRARKMPRALSCRFLRRIKPSHHTRRDTPQSEVLVCHQSSKWRRLRHRELLSSSCTRHAAAAASMFSCPTIIECCSLSWHQLCWTSAAAATGRGRQQPLCYETHDEPDTITVS